MLREDPNAVPPPSPGPAHRRLDSWKEIAAYLKRDVSTVQRWEKRESLPVYRHVHEKLGTVYAFEPELDAWWNNRRRHVEPQTGSNGIRPGWLAAGAAILIGGVILAWSGRTLLRWQRAPDRSEIVTRRIWTGPDLSSLGTVSPDGRRLVYRDPETADLAIREIVTGEQRRLTRKPPKARTGGAESPTFSPDGKRIAYSWDQAFYYELRLIESDGSGERVLYQDAEVFFIAVADWSPDGQHILATFVRKDRTHQIVLISVVDSSVRVLKTLDWRSPSRMNFSSDGRFIAYDCPPRDDSPARDICLVSITDGRQITLVEHPADDYLLGWTPDGKGVLFASDRTDAVDAWLIQIGGGKPQGAPLLVKKDIGSVWPVGFARSGAYYYGVQTSKEEVYLAELDPATGRIASDPAPVARRFAGFNRSPDWSPDGRRLAYVSQRTPATRWPTPRIILRWTKTGEERELRPKLNFVEMLRWSPDARSFLAMGSDMKHQHGLFKVDAETGDASPVVQSDQPSAMFHAPAWSPDGRTIFYKLRNKGMEPAPLLVRDLETGREKQVLPSVYRFDLSRDGKWLAFSSFDEQFEFLGIKPAGGGEVRELYREPRSGRIYSVAWTPDGRYLLFSKKGQLWRIPAAGGEPEKLPLTMTALRELRPHPDGKRIVFTAGAAKAEVWAMENFLPAR
ncbi:MAG: PD40 domain-containing protein [Acidobacteria bacterium]|nr:PD40 domain-containing protein [Acidobacteriota bacterium]